MNTTDIAAVRALVPLFRQARAAGWHHWTVDGDLGVEHLWRSPRPHRHYSEVVALYDGQFRYREVDSLMPLATLPARSAPKVADWLRLLGLISPVAQLGICDACGVDLDRVEAGIAEHMADECVPADER